MKTVLQIELDSTNEGRYFAVGTIPNDPKEYVTEDMKTPRQAVLRCLSIWERKAGIKDES